VKPIIDIAYARTTHDSLFVVKGAIAALAVERGVTITNQSEVDGLLEDIQVGRHREDTWGRPLRASYVSAGVFHVISDGPDMTQNTEDDLSTAETLDAYLDRIFPDQFARP
jgi:hypothetical protein